MSNKPVSDHKDFLTALIETIRDLTGILSREMKLLKTSRPAEVQKLLPIKNQLMASYHREMAELASRGGLQASGNGPAIRMLKQEARIFQETLTRHKRLVMALKKISESMIKAISEEVVKSENRTNRYAADGTKSARRSPTSITLNQTV